MNDEKKIIKNCLFCNMIKGKVPSKKIAESTLAYAFHDINPQAPIHALIIPKIHISNAIELSSLNIDYFGGMVLLANEIIKKMDMDKKGFRWIVNTGEDGGQTVNHIHLHLLAGRRLIWPPG